MCKRREREIEDLKTSRRVTLDIFDSLSILKDIHVSEYILANQKKKDIDEVRQDNG